jgi:hypothetical protein
VSEGSDGLSGGCLCGQVRYVARGAPINVRACHCRTCQKMSGGGFWARAMFRKDALSITGATRGFPTSEALIRRFCPGCGSFIFTERLDQPIMGVSLATLDDPEALRPEAQIFVSRRFSWLCAGDVEEFGEWAD